NAPIISKSISAYASQLSLGVSVADYIHIPRFDERDEVKLSISEISSRLSKNSDSITDADLMVLNEKVKALLGVS
ncbi:MAG: hypothetical protein Q8J60_00585, partial [Thiobacillus sp.]|nr:hypothetical protein [Thiobacillus sp.]